MYITVPLFHIDQFRFHPRIAVVKYELLLHVGLAKILNCEYCILSKMKYLELRQYYIRHFILEYVSDVTLTFAMYI